MIYWATRHRLEIGFNVTFFVLLPFLAKIFSEKLQSLAVPLGADGLAGRLAGAGGWTDIGWEVAAASALANPNYLAYATLSELEPLAGMGWLNDQSISRPPISIAPFLVLVPFSYASWLPFWISGSIVAIAASMRFMGVPAWVAYPLTLAVTLSFSGQFSLTSTYPLAALLLALTWRWRHRPWLGGFALAGFGLVRGFGLILILYPLIRRRWKIAVVAAGTVLVSTATALVLEPESIAGFLGNGRESIELNLLAGNNVTPITLGNQWNLPSVVIYISALGLAAWSLRQRQSLFWVLVWLSFAITPIGWYHSAVAGIPLLVHVWRLSVVGRISVLTTAGLFLASHTYMSYSWLVMVASTGLALIWPKPGSPDEPDRQSRDDLSGNRVNSRKSLS